MPEQHVKLGDMAGLQKLIRADMRALKRRVEGAIVKTARAGADICKANVPDEFHEVRPGIRVVRTEGTIRIRSEAPHSEVLELGKQRAKQWGGLPAVEDLAAWVRAHGSGRGSAGAPVRRALRSLQRRGGRGQGSASPVDAPLRIAWAIIGSINKHNIAYQFMGKAVPDVYRILDTMIQNAMDSKVELGSAVLALAASSSLGAGGAIGLGGKRGKLRLGSSARKLARMSGRKAR